MNVYVGIGSFEPGTARKGTHCTGKKALYVDIDCGPDKPYKTQKDALLAIKKLWWSDKSCPNPTYVVNSGNGIHMYWVLTDTITPVEWSPLATGLQRLCLSVGLHVDTQVTTDVARIMRAVGSDNHKRDTPRPCKRRSRRRQARD